MNALLAALVVADTWDMHDWGGGTWVVMMVGMLLFWALVILGVVWIVRELGSSRSARDDERPSDILDQRLARGEISPEEYAQARRALGLRQGGA